MSDSFNKPLRYNDAIWAPLLLKSPISQRSFEKFAQAIITENVNNRVDELYGVVEVVVVVVGSNEGFISQRVSNTKSFGMS